MESLLLDNESTLRLGIFVFVLLTIAAWELLRPRRRLQFSKLARWVNNLLLMITNTLALRVLFPTAAIGTAIFVQQNQWGILNNLPLPSSLAIFIAIITLDLIIYWQHRLFHTIAWLWQLHQVHHADPDYDVTTAVRFHPIEILISMAIKVAAITLLGAPVIAVLMFEILLNACALFNHGNITLAKRLDEILRTLIVTPDMHRVHHSNQLAETNSNYGFCLSIWDRCFGSYKQDAQLGQTGMIIGLDYISQPKTGISVVNLLAMPFTIKPKVNKP